MTNALWRGYPAPVQPVGHAGIRYRLVDTLHSIRFTRPFPRHLLGLEFFRRMTEEEGVPSRPRSLFVDPTSRDIRRRKRRTTLALVSDHQLENGRSGNARGWDSWQPARAQGSSPRACSGGRSERNPTKYCPTLAGTCSHRNNSDLRKRNWRRRAKSFAACAEFVGTCDSGSNKVAYLSR